jgi:TRAP transporter TAXI family solute receptor
MKMRFWGILLAFFLVLAAIPAGAAEPPLKFIRIAGGGMGGAWYLGAAKMASFCEKIWPGISASSTPGGGVANMLRLDKNEYQIAFTFTDTIYAASKGKPPFKKPIDLRFLCSTNAAYVQTIAQPSIKSYKDLKGKTACAGDKGKSGYDAFMKILKAYGMEKDVKMVSASYDKMPDLFVDGVVDADMVYGSVPHLVPNEILVRRKARFLSMEDPIRKKMVDAYGGMVDLTIKANSFKTQDYPVKTVGSMTAIVCRPDVPDEVIYKLLKYTWEHRPDLISAHVVYKDFTEETVPLGRTIPWHPAAEKFWKEVGALK